MQYLIGIDGGGSHTEGMLCRADGTAILRTVGGPSSVSGTELSVAIENILSVVKALLAALPEGGSVKTLYAGISGCGIEKDKIIYQRRLAAALPMIASVHVGSDVFSPAYAAGYSTEMVTAICGTGSIAYAVTEGRTLRVDGYGHLLGDDAGGFAIGRQVFNAVLRYEDGRGAPTALADLLYEKTGKTASAQATAVSEAGKSAVAAFAPLAFAGKDRGDPVATAILGRAAAELAEIVRAAARHMKRSPVPVITGGSLFAADGAYLLRRVQQALGEGYLWVENTLPVIYGAVMHAAELAEIKDFTIKE